MNVEENRIVRLSRDEVLEAITNYLMFRNQLSPYRPDQATLRYEDPHDGQAGYIVEVELSRAMPTGQQEDEE